MIKKNHTKKLRFSPLKCYRELPNESGKGHLNNSTASRYNMRKLRKILFFKGIQTQKICFLRKMGNKRERSRRKGKGKIIKRRGKKKKLFNSKGIKGNNY